MPSKQDTSSLPCRVVVEAVVGYSALRCGVLRGELAHEQGSFGISFISPRESCGSCTLFLSCHWDTEDPIAFNPSGDTWLALGTGGEVLAITLYSKCWRCEAVRVIKLSRVPYRAHGIALLWDWQSDMGCGASHPGSLLHCWICIPLRESNQ